MKSTLSQLVYSYLKDNKYQLDWQEWQLQLKAHPDYPSLRSVTDTMDFFDIEHIAAIVPKESLEELPDRFMAIIQPSAKMQELAWVRWEGSFFSLKTESQQSRMSKEDFLHIWEGLVLVVEENEGKTLLMGSQKLSLLYSAAILFLLFSFIISDPGQVHLIYTLLSCLGLALAITITRTQLGYRSSLIDKICKAGKQSSCEEVLESKGAVLGGLPLSDLALVYFLTTTTLLCFGQFQYGLFFLLGITGLPVILYSLLYQWRVVKKWCLLCLGLVAVLGLQFSLLMVFQQPLALALDGLVQLGAVAALAASFWHFVKPLLIKQNQQESISLQLARFKKDPVVFELLLAQQQQYPAAESSEMLLLGNPKASFRLQVITNPLCRYCKAAFEVYEKILHRYGDRLCLELRFNVFLDDPEDVSRRIALRAIEIYTKQGAGAFVEAMADWFRHYDWEGWRSRWGHGEHPEHLSLLENHKLWCYEQDINFTPATLVQQRLLPQHYELMDLLYLLEDLISEASRQEVLTPRAEYGIRLPEAG